MGDNLPAVDLGTGKTATAVTAGGMVSCALLSDGTVKCWGNNDSGTLGQGLADRGLGDDPGEMGDNLPPIDLGSGRTATVVATNGNGACALLDDGTIKCWGSNSNGQAGYGHGQGQIGREPGEMGENVPAVDLGTGKTATDIAVGDQFTCALLNDGTIKCWGRNNWGQLGYGHTDRVGDDPGEMGDNLPVVDLGTGRTATDISVATWHTCALLDDSTIKCWGRNVSGQLGYGDISTRGDNPGEMGDNLPVVDLGTGKTATAISTGMSGSCALLNDGTLKCWGNSGWGQLGQGSRTWAGGQPGEMGDNLPIVDLGS
jgi:alpha-tubulin suppressor-like RCC1 family protein